MNSGDIVETYDVTIDLHDEYMGLVGRPVGERLSEIFRSRLKQTKENGTLVLDFSLVSTISPSFMDSYLMPVLSDIRNGKYVGRYVVAVNIKPSLIMQLQRHMEHKLRERQMIFSVFSVSKQPQWLGVGDELELKVLKLLFAVGNLTLKQIAMELDLPTQKTEEVVGRLIERRAVKTGETKIGHMFCSPLMSRSSLDSMAISIGELLREMIGRYKAVEYGGHYLLPSGVHAEQLLHLSKILVEPRFVARLGRYISTLFDGVQVVLTTRTHNNIVIGQEVAASYGDGTAVVYANTSEDGEPVRFVLKEDYDIRQKRALVLGDVVSTGYVMNLLFDLAIRESAEVVGGCCIVDVGGRRTSFPFRLETLLELPLKIYPREQCPLCRASIPVIMPKILPPRL